MLFADPVVTTAIIVGAGIAIVQLDDIAVPHASLIVRKFRAIQVRRRLEMPDRKVNLDAR